MDIDEFQIVKMTEEYAALVSKWKYEDEYSFYDHNENDINSYLCDEYFACVNNCGELIGYFCFGQDARIPTVEKDPYVGDFLDIGLGLKPDLCGLGFGPAFLEKGLKYAESLFNTKSFRLSVAVFNVRAIKVYEKAGFYIDREVTNSYYGNKFVIMIKED